MFISVAAALNAAGRLPPRVAHISPARRGAYHARSTCVCDGQPSYSAADNSAEKSRNSL